MPDEIELPDSMFLVGVADETGDHPINTLSFTRNPTVLLAFAANRFTRSSARLYKERFGIGAMDWRMLVMLTRVPGSSVAVASRTIGIDKAAVSRSLKRLKSNGLAEDVCNNSDERRREWSLTAKGRDLHENMLAVALERQKELLSGFSAEDVHAFNGYLQRFLDNVSQSNGDTD